MTEILALAANIVRCYLRNRSIMLITLVISIIGTFSFYYLSSSDAKNFQLGLELSLSIVMIFLLFSLIIKTTIYVSESYETWQIHLYYVRPISPIKIFCGHIFGFILYALIVLTFFIPIFSSAAYYQYNNLTTLEKSRVKELVLEPREYISTEKRDFSKLSEMVLKKRIENGMPSGYTLEVLREEILG
ncbi:MAG: hypothetical protein ACRC37_00695, partial [Lentisphaeria bacterium]